MNGHFKWEDPLEMKVFVGKSNLCWMTLIYFDHFDHFAHCHAIVIFVGNLGHITVVSLSLSSGEGAKEL